MMTSSATYPTWSRRHSSDTLEQVSVHILKPISCLTHVCRPTSIANVPSGMTLGHAPTQVVQSQQWTRYVAAVHTLELPMTFLQSQIPEKWRAKALSEVDPVSRDTVRRVVLLLLKSIQ